MVSRDEFRTFIAPFMDKYKNIQALVWIPNVHKSRREEIENTGRRDGFEGFDIRELDNNGQLVTAGIRDQYFPLFYAEPLLGNENAIGLDMASNEQKLAALTNARVTGKAVATAPMPLDDRKDTDSSILVFHPVYNHTVDKDATDDVRSIKGFIVLALKTNSLVNDVFNSVEGANQFTYKTYPIQITLKRFLEIPFQRKSICALSS
jgi:CHASE1-domain containing sensor protein